MNKAMVLVSLVAGAATLLAVEPRTIYVDQSVPASGDGTTWAKAFKTIQEGVNDASAEVVDTVLVAPGVYGDGDGCQTVTSGSRTQKARVNITKKLILKSDKGKEETHIVGHRGDGAGNAVDEIGPVMCVRVNAAGTIVEGFTIRDGEMNNSLGSAGPAGVGNPFSTSYSFASSNLFYVAYCTISNCCAQRGSAQRGGTAIATLFSENYSYPYDKGSSDTAMNLFAYNCIFTRSGTLCPGMTAGHACIGGYYEFVNCTIANNRAERGATSQDSTCKAYNVAQLANGKGGDNVAGIAINCVYDGGASALSKKTDTTGTVVLEKLPNASGATGHDQTFMGAPAGDFRPVDGGYLFGKDGHYGDIRYTNSDFIPDAYKQTDFYGNKLANDAKIPIGVILPAGGPDKTAPVKVTLHKITDYENQDLVIDEGKALVSGQYIHSDTPLRQLEIKPSWTGNLEVVCLEAASVTNGVAQSKYYVFPLRKGDGNGYLFTMYPAQAETDVCGISPIIADGVYYVDRNNGKDDDPDYDGSSPDKAFASLNAAAAVLPAGSSGGFKGYVVHVAEGTYDNNTQSAKSWVSGSTDVDMPARLLFNKGSVYVSFRATGARERTIIRGAADPGTDDGCGPAAARCVLVRATSPIVHVSGFTLSGGHTNGQFDKTYPDGRGNYGAAALCSGEYGLLLQDCTVTDNTGVSVVYFTAVNRCVFKGNRGMTGAGADNRAVAGRGYVYCSVFEDNVDSNMRLTSAINGQECCNCTYYCPNASDSIYNTSDSIRNAIIYTQNGYFPQPKANCGMFGCMLWGTLRFGENVSGYVRASPKFSAAQDGDYRLNYNSPARAPVWTDDWHGGEITTTMAKRFSGDLNGDPLHVTEDAAGNVKIALGAVHSMGSKTGPSGMLLLFR